MCTLHGSASLTGYMLKLVDVVPHLLRLLPFNLGRGSTEGSESLHHFRTKDYFWWVTSLLSCRENNGKQNNNNVRATNRGGGKGDTPAFEQLFQREYRSLLYMAQSKNLVFGCGKLVKLIYIINRKCT